MFRPLLCLLLLTACAFGQTATPKPTPRPPDPSLVPIQDVPGLPRVLVIGDSISMGYIPPLRTALKDKANIHHPPVNCGASGFGATQLDKWLGTEKWDVITFNFGLHDLKYMDATGKKLVPPDQGKQVASLEEYSTNLHTIAKRLKTTGAKVFFVTTTPVPSGSEGRVEGDEKKYNAAAVEVMKAEGIDVIDLCNFVVPIQSEVQRPHNVHYTGPGYAKLADFVAEKITPALPAPKK
jgi:acyl-CoA thioesterase-1